MSEKQPIDEVLSGHEVGRNEVDDNKIDHPQSNHKEGGQDELLENARHEVTRHISGTEKDNILNKLKTEQVPSDSEEDVSRRPINSELKKLTFDKEIKHIRRRLGKADRLGSRIIHQPVVRSISGAASQTISRPSGLLGGGIVAFLGSLTYLYLTKHIGLKYNYSMLFFLLIAGFILGLAIEALIRLYRRRRPN